MKRIVRRILLATLGLLLLTGCTAPAEGAVPALFPRRDGIVGAEVSSLPEGYHYSLDAQKAQELVSYFAELTLTANFSENPEEYGGMTWVVSVTYKDGTVAQVYHFGNTFVRGEDGPWYKMDYDEANKIESFFSEGTAAQNLSECLREEGGQTILVLPLSGMRHRPRSRLFS